MAEQLASIDDVRTKLHRAICMIDGEPVYVDCTGTDGRFVAVCPLYPSRSKAFVTDYTADAFTYDDIELGYVNTEDDVAVFLSVPAVRHSRLGLRIENVVSSSIEYSALDLYRSKGFVDCIKGKYPSYQTALEKISKCPVGKSIAFNRNMCLHKIRFNMIKIMHCTSYIGYVKDGIMAPSPEANPKVFNRVMQGVLK